MTSKSTKALRKKFRREIEQHQSEKASQRAQAVRSSHAARSFNSEDFAMWSSLLIYFIVWFLAAPL